MTNLPVINLQLLINTLISIVNFQVLQTIQRDNLLTRVQKSGDVMVKGLLELEEMYPDLVNSSRGRGTFCAIDASSVEIRLADN